MRGLCPGGGLLESGDRGSEALAAGALIDMHSRREWTTAPIPDRQPGGQAGDRVEAALSDRGYPAQHHSLSRC